MTDSNQPNDWTDEEYLSAVTGKARCTLRAERSRGAPHPPFYKFGQKVRYRRSEVEAWIATCRRIPAATALAAS